MSDAMALAHYRTYGMFEGRVYRLDTPDDFEASEYKQLNRDLQHMTDMEATVHYSQYGKKEQRAYRAINVQDIIQKICEEPVQPVQQIQQIQQIGAEVQKLYVVIPSLKGYELALNYILESLPAKWRSS